MHKCTLFLTCHNQSIGETAMYKTILSNLFMNRKINKCYSKGGGGQNLRNPFLGSVSAYHYNFGKKLVALLFSDPPPPIQQFHQDKNAYKWW